MTTNANGYSLYDITFRVSGKRASVTWQQYHPNAEAAAEVCARMAAREFYAAITVVSVQRAGKPCESTTVRRSGKGTRCACCGAGVILGYECVACGDVQCRACVEHPANIGLVAFEDGRSWLDMGRAPVAA